MQAFTTSHTDPLTAAAAAILFNEDLTTVKDKVKGLKVGDVTNFGTVKNISDTSIEFKARDTGVTKISLNQRKMGSKDFVLDKLIKLKEEVTELEEATYSFQNKMSGKVRKIKANSDADAIAKMNKIHPVGDDALKHAKVSSVEQWFKQNYKIFKEEVGEEDTIEEGINFAAVAAAKKAGMSDAAIDSYVKIHKANGATDKEISAALLSGKAMKKEGGVERREKMSHVKDPTPDSHNESVELEEGVFGGMLKKAALMMASPKDLADGWYDGAESEMKKLKPSLTHDNVEKFVAASLALSRVRDEAAAMKSAKETMEFLGDAAKIESLIKKHTEEIFKKGVLNMKEDTELEEDSGRHTPNVTKAMNFVKGFEDAELESFLLSLAEFFMYQHDDTSNAQGVGSFLKKGYTEWKQRK
jgi:hypothetical protein